MEMMSVNHSMLLGQVLCGTVAIKLNVKVTRKEKNECWSVNRAERGSVFLVMSQSLRQNQKVTTQKKRKNKKQTCPSVKTDDDEGVVNLKWFCCHHIKPESDTATTNRYQSIKNALVKTAVKPACQWLPMLSATHSPIFVELYCSETCCETCLSMNPNAIRNSLTYFCWTVLQWNLLWKPAGQWIPALSATHSPIFVELYCKTRHGLHGFVGKCQLHKYLSASPCKCTVDF